MSAFIVLTASASVPSSYRGQYRRVAVLEVEDGMESPPKMISERARGVIEIVETWERLHVGKTERGAYQQALVDAHALARELNGGE